MFVGTDGNPAGLCCGCGRSETVNETVFPSLILVTASSGVSAVTAICLLIIHSAILFLLLFPQEIVRWVGQVFSTPRARFQDFSHVVD